MDKKIYRTRLGIGSGTARDIGGTSKVKGYTSALRNLKHSTRHLSTIPSNINKNMISKNIFIVGDKLLDSSESPSSIFNSFKNQFDDNLQSLRDYHARQNKVNEKKYPDRVKTFNQAYEKTNLLGEIVLNITNEWWEQQGFVTFKRGSGLVWDGKLGERVLKPNAILGIETIDQQKLTSWIKSNKEWFNDELRKKYTGDSNFIGACLHVDENNVHAHIFYTGIESRQITDKFGNDRVLVRSNLSKFDNGEKGMYKRGERLWELKNSYHIHNQSNFDKNLLGEEYAKDKKYTSLSKYKSKQHNLINSSIAELNNKLENTKAITTSIIKSTESLMRAYYIAITNRDIERIAGLAKQLMNFGYTASELENIKKEIEKGVENNGISR